MIIKAKPLPMFLIRWGALVMIWLVGRRFNKMLLHPIEIKAGHSYLLMCNHFGFLDGFFAYYICFKYLDKKQKIKALYTMSVKKQMEKNWWLKYLGSFSVQPGSWSVRESLAYAAEKLNEPGNILLYYPQGNLESNHIRHIEFRDGIAEIIQRVKGNCQLIWSSNLLEYFESTKPSVYYNLLDCGQAADFDFYALKKQVNDFHLKSIQGNFRFTEEPGC